MKFGLTKRTPEAWRGEIGSGRLWLILAVACVGVFLFALLRGGASRRGSEGAVEGGVSSSEGDGSRLAARFRDRPRARLVSEVSAGGAGGGNPGAVVAEKVVQFSRSRRQVLETMAQRLNVAVPPDVDRFFSAVESGEWRDIKTLYNTVSALVSSDDAPPGLASLWPAIRETYAVAEAKEVWPADQLLSFGQTVLSSVDPGAVFVGTSQWGRSIPALLNETSGDARGVVLDHLMLSEPGYTDYLATMYGDRLKALTQEDAQKAKDAYLAELAERAKNNQLRPGETLPSGNMRSFVPGSIAATEVAEKMLMAFLEKNPGVAIMMEKPTQGSSLYSLATPVGPVFEIRAQGAEGGSGPAAQQTAQYWKDATDRLQSIPITDENVVTRRSFAEMATAQANLLASRSQPVEAEQTFRSAIEIAPMSVEPVNAMIAFLQNSGRGPEAMQVVEEFARRNPDLATQADLMRARLAGPKN